MMTIKPSFVILFLLTTLKGYAQQDLDFSFTGQLLTSQKILKIKRDFVDSYLWALAQNNEVYRINTQTQAIDNYTAKFAAYSNYQFIDS